MGVMKTQRKSKLPLSLILGCLLSLVAATRGEIVVDHQPHNFGGFASDTEFLDDFGNPFSQLVADDFLLSDDIALRRIAFWGFYHDDAAPLTETMRIRVLGARATDGLPDDENIFVDEIFVNPLREWTGRIIFLGVAPREYRYSVDLESPALLYSGIPYWLEIVQLGDVASLFRWEFSRADENGQAFNNPIVGDWQATQSVTSDTAFQLDTVPESGTAMPLLFSYAILPRFRRVRR
jgi:hypothetical protein